MPPYFKEKFFESIQMIFVWKYNTNDFFIPYVLSMDVLYKKCWCCLRSDYIIHNILSYLYPLLWPFTSIVVGDGQYYVLLLGHYITARRDWTIRAVCSMIPELTYHRTMPPYFKEMFFESIQMIFVWKYNKKYVFIPYVLAMDVLYNKCWCCLRSDYIIHNILSYLYRLILPFTFIVVGGDQYYVLLLVHYITVRRD